MGTALDRNTGRLHALKCLHINAGGCQERFAQRLPEFRIKDLQILFVDIKNLADKGKSVAVYTRRSDADQCITGLYVLSGDQILFITDTDGKPARSYSSSGINPGCSAVSPPTSAHSDCLQPSATPFTIAAIFSGTFFPHAI